MYSKRSSYPTRNASEAPFFLQDHYCPTVPSLAQCISPSVMHLACLYTKVASLFFDLTSKLKNISTQSCLASSTIQKLIIANSLFFHPRKLSPRNSSALAKGTWLILFLAGIFFFTQPLQAQQTALASGGNGSGTGGSFAYSVGQTMYTSQSNSATSLSKGVQQGFELFLITGLEDEDRFGLAATVFPNPTSSYLTVEIKNYSPGTAMEIFLFDAKGQQVHRQKVVDVQTQIAVEYLSSALYVLKLIQGNKLVKVIKVIKK
jgi:hypothetical protein